MIYCQRLKSLREDMELKQKTIANILNIDVTSYCHYENEDDILPIKHINALCNYFQVSIDFLFGFTSKSQYLSYKIDIDSKKIGIRLKEFRKENKLTQKKLAIILNTVQPVIANYENGKHIISTPFLYTICKKYGISADYLLGRTDAPKHLI